MRRTGEIVCRSGSRT